MKTLGIIGAGQLSLFLAEAAQKLGIQTHILGDAHQSAMRVANEKFIQSEFNVENVCNFLNTCDFGTIESEFVDSNIIEQALHKAEKRVQFTPLPKSIRIAQDKLSQKELFARLHVPTPKHREVTAESLTTYFDEILWEDFPEGVVLKWAKFGYDGKGNFLLDEKEKTADAIAFCKAAFAKNIRIYAEEKVSFDAELAMIFMRTIRGELHHYPLVISQQLKGTCKIVEGPATSLGIPHRMQSDAIEIGRAVGDALLLTGVFAIEFFYSSKRGIMANEMAPRVHNSGHYTLDGAECSQFENHVRIACGQSVGSTGTNRYFAMLNLLGPEDLTLSLDSNFKLPIPISKTMSTYWYYKTELKPGRKMGHINIKANEVHELQAGINMMKLYESDLWNSLRNR